MQSDHVSRDFKGLPCDLQSIYQPEHTKRHILPQSGTGYAAILLRIFHILFEGQKINVAAPYPAENLIPADLKQARYRQNVNAVGTPTVHGIGLRIAQISSFRKELDVRGLVMYSGILILRCSCWYGCVYCDPE